MHRHDRLLIDYNGFMQLVFRNFSKLSWHDERKPFQRVKITIWCGKIAVRLHRKLRPELHYLAH